MAKEFLKITLVSINNGAHYNFMLAVAEKAKADAKVYEKAKALTDALVAAVAKENEVLVLTKKNETSDAIGEADRMRDAYFRGYRDGVQGFARFPAGAQKTAADKLAQHLKDYRIDPKMQLDRETGLMTNLVEDLTGKFAAQVTALGLGPFVEGMKAANEEVRKGLASRDAENSVIAMGAMKAAREKTDGAYLSLAKRVNAYAEIEGDADYAAFIDFVNEQIKRFKQEVLPAHKKGDKPGKDRPNNKKEKLQKEFDEKVAPLIAAFEQQEGLAAGSLKFAGKATGRGADRKYELAVSGTEKTIWVQVKGDHLVQVVSVKPKE